MLHDIEQKRGFAHGGAGGDHEKLTGFQSVDHAVEYGISRSESEHGASVIHHFFHVAHRRLDILFEAPLGGCERRFTDIHHFLLSRVEQLVNFRFR